MKNLQNLALLFFALLFLGFGLTGCKGGEAVDKLGELKDKACGCKGDAKCMDEAKQLATDWAKEYTDARGGDKDKAEEHMKGLLTCAPGVALHLGEEIKKNEK